MSIPKLQHYVPQLILRNFGNKKNQIWVFDKKNEREYLSNIRNAAGENRFYNFEFAGENFSLESHLTQVESDAAPSIASLLEADSVGVLGDRAKHSIARFVACQLTRGPVFRQQYADLPVILNEALHSRGIPASGQQLTTLARTQSDNDVRVATIKLSLKMEEEIVAELLSKDWFLAATDIKCPFFIGDNPVTLQNDVNKAALRSNLGIASPGIEIYMPFSPTRTLVFLCKSKTALLKESSRIVRDRKIILPGASQIIGFEVSLAQGLPVRYSSENVENLNSLQLVNAERFLFSYDGNFEMPREVLRDHPSRWSGPRMKIQ